MKRNEFQNNEYYHIYNRGVDKRQVFNDNYDYNRFLTSMKEFNRIKPVGSLYELQYLGVQLPSDKQPLVEVFCYCLLPNHYHLILKQIEDNGIEKIMHKINTGYTNYFNKKNNRSGSLFQGRYKAKHIYSTYYLEYISAYVLGNSEIHELCEFDKWQWSNLKYFFDDRNEVKEFNKLILGNYWAINEFEKYVKMIIIKSKKVKNKLNGLILDD